MFRHRSLFTLLLLGSAGLFAPQAVAQQDTPPAPTEEVPTIAEAQALIGQQEWQQASVAFAKIVIDQPDNALAWQLLGYCLHANGDLDRALRVHQKAAEFEQTRAIATYNVACVHALQGRTDAAFEALFQAYEAGFRDANQYGSDADLRSLHEDPRWKELGAMLTGGVTRSTSENENGRVVEEVVVLEDALVQRDLGTAIKLAKLPAERRFDFWLGDWDLYVEGEKVGEWTIKQQLDGTVIQQVGPEGMTIVNFEPNTKKWHMTWVSKQGHHDVLVGGLEGDRMVMHQKIVREEPGAIGRWIMQSVHSDYWEADWQLSRDGGKSWDSEFLVSCWRRASDQAQAASSKAKADAGDAARYDFLLGDFDVKFKAMMPDQTWVEGEGTSMAKRKDDGSIVEKQMLKASDGTVWEGVTTRVADGSTYAVNWTSADGATSVDSKSVREGKKIVEITVGEDTYGPFRDKIYYTDISKSGYSVWLDRTYTESGTEIEGLYRAWFTRKK